MEAKYLKTGQSIDMAIEYYGYTTWELAEKVYGGRNPDCVNKLRKRLKKWLKEALVDLPYDNDETVWDHYAKDKSKESSDRLLPEFVVQRWYMEIHRERFREFFRKIEEQPVRLEKTKEAIDREEERLTEAERTHYGVEPYSSDMDYSKIVRETSEHAAKAEIAEQKFKLLWEDYMSMIGKDFSETQERKFIDEWCKRDLLISDNDYGATYQELDRKLKDIRNYFK